MAKVITTELQHSGASAANITLDSSKNVTCENNLTVDGTSTLSGNVAVTGNVTVTGTLPADKLTGALPAISGASLTGVTDTLSFRNLVINGAMNVAQRGTSDTSDVQGYTTVDRWQIGWGGADAIIETHQETLSSSDTGPWAKGFRHAYKLVNGNQSSGAGAGDSCVAQYRIEAQDLAGSGWNYTDPNSKITLSFWVKSSVAQAFQMYLRTPDGTSQEYSFNTGALSANTWTKVTKTIPGNSNIQIDNNNGPGMYITIWQFVGTDYTDSVSDDAWRAYNGSSRTNASATGWWTTNDATFHITGVQLEVGDTATEFEHRSYGDELARCRRYYHHWVDSWDGTEATTGLMFQSYSSSGGHCPIHLIPQMRAVPTTKVSNSSNAWQYIDGGSSDDFDQIVGNSTSIWTNQNIELYAQGNLGTTSGHAAFVRCKSSPNTTYLAFDAEL